MTFADHASSSSGDPGSSREVIEATSRRLRSRQRQAHIPAAALFVLLATIIVKSAWIGDDAYIPIRSVDNLLHGYGLRWNIDDRVQTFTDPLWTLLSALFYTVTHEVFITTMLLSIVTSLAAVAVLLRYGMSSAAGRAATLVGLLSSKAFVDYTTSGLENPLSYLLVVTFGVLFIRAPVTRKTFRWLIFVYALAGFDRLDLLLLLGPALLLGIWIVWRQGTRLPALIADLLIFSVPLSGWLLFTTIYYGYTLPNTYFAKLYTGIPGIELIKQGLLYYLNSIEYDPATLITIALALVSAFLAKDLRVKIAALGLFLYLLYVIKIGGDFMSGRFFSVPFFYAMFLVAQIELRRLIWLALALGWLGIGLTAKYPPLFYNEEYRGAIDNPDPTTRTSDVTDRRGIADERGWYFRTGGLVTAVNRDNAKPWNPWALDGMSARRFGNVDLVGFSTPGLYGYYAGPGVHIVDTFALGDPLLSHLPVYNAVHWKVGHYGRSIPVGYIETLQTGENKIEDPNVRELYRVTKILTRDPIWSVARFKEIVRANLRLYDSLSRTAPREGTVPPYPIGERVTYASRRPRNPLYGYNTPVNFSFGGDWEDYRSDGWGGADQEHAWTVGPVASLLFATPQSDKPVYLQIEASAELFPEDLSFQPVDVEINGRPVAHWEISKARTLTAVIPADLLKSPRNDLSINLRMPNAISPRMLHIGMDRQRYCLRVMTVTISSEAKREQIDRARAADAKEPNK